MKKPNYINIKIIYFFLYKFLKASETMDILSYYQGSWLFVGRGTVGFEQHVGMRSEDSSLKTRKVSYSAYIIDRSTTGPKKIILLMFMYCT